MERRSVRMVLALILFASAALGGASAASAKGASEATITGPGISTPIVLEDPSDVDALAQASGFFGGLWCRTCDGRLRHRPSGMLGPRYTVTYTMPSPTDANRSSEVVQYVFPLAIPDPVTYVPAGQPFWSQATIGGWFVARPGLRSLLTDLGVPSPQTSPRAAQRSATRDERSSPWVAAAATAAALSLLLLAVLALSIRRRVRMRATHLGG